MTVPLNYNISQLYVMLMSDRMKAEYLLAFCSSFLKIDLKWVKKIQKDVA